MVVAIEHSSFILTSNGLRDLWNVVTRYKHWYQCVYLINIPEPLQYHIYAMAFLFDIRCESVTCISYNTGKSALPDIYTRCPRVCSAQGQVCIISNKAEVPVLYYMLHFRHSKIHPNLKATAQLAYLVADANCDYRRLF